MTPCSLFVIFLRQNLAALAIAMRSGDFPGSPSLSLFISLPVWAQGLHTWLSVLFFSDFDKDLSSHTGLEDQIEHV